MAQLQSLADAPGTLREYETIYILRPDTQNDKVAEVNQRVRGIIESQGGVILSVDNWGKRKLAYEISKELKGIYLYWKYLGQPEVVAEFERNMRMLDTVIRYMTVMCGRDVDPNARPSEVTEESFEKAASTAADEDELMMRRNGEGGEEDEFGALGEDEAAAEATAEATAEPAGEVETAEPGGTEEKASSEEEDRD
jgi:small subunit ribosomal protein S6